MLLAALKPRFLAGGAALLLALAACTTGANGGGGSPTLSVVSPQNGAQVSVPFTVQVDSNVPLGDPSSGNRHVHIYFDSITTNTADYDIVYGTSETVTRQLTPGKHTLIVALANPDHSLAGPKQEITVTVTGSGAGGGGSATPAPSSGNGY